MGKYVPAGIYEPEEQRSGNDAVLWIVILGVILCAVGWYGMREGWFAGHSSLRGEIVDNYSKSFTSGHLVLMDSRGSKCFETGISGEGTYEFVNIRPGNYDVRLETVYGYYPGSYPVKLRKNKTETIKLFVEQSWLSARKLEAAKAKAAGERNSGGGGG